MCVHTMFFLQNNWYTVGCILIQWFYHRAKKARIFSRWSLTVLLNRNIYFSHIKPPFQVLTQSCSELQLEMHLVTDSAINYSPLILIPLLGSRANDIFVNRDHVELPISNCYANAYKWCSNVKIFQLKFKVDLGKRYTIENQLRTIKSTISLYFTNFFRNRSVALDYSTKGLPYTMQFPIIWIIKLL